MMSTAAINSIRLAARTSTRRCMATSATATKTAAKKVVAPAPQQQALRKETRQISTNTANVPLETKFQQVIQHEAAEGIEMRLRRCGNAIFLCV